MQTAEGPLVCMLTQGNYVVATSETTRAVAPTIVLAFTPEQALATTWLLTHCTAELALRNDLDVGFADLDLPPCDPSLLTPP